MKNKNMQEKEKNKEPNYNQPKKLLFKFDGKLVGWRKIKENSKSLDRPLVPIRTQEFIKREKVPYSKSKKQKRKRSMSKDDQKIPCKKAKKKSRCSDENHHDIRPDVLERLDSIDSKFTQFNEQMKLITASSQVIILSSVDFNENSLEINNNHVKTVISDKLQEIKSKFIPPMSEERRKLKEAEMKKTKVESKEVEFNRNVSSAPSQDIQTFPRSDQSTSVPMSSKEINRLALVRKKTLSTSESRVPSPVPSTSKNIITNERNYLTKTSNSTKDVDIKQPRQVNAITLNTYIGKIRSDCFYKDRECFKEMIEKGGLWAHYKCMGVNCSYFTSKKENFLQHLIHHEKSPSAIEDYYKNCSYCFGEFQTCSALAEHLEVYHKNCHFQCSVCFYRAAESQSIYDHHEQYHGFHSHKILDCREKFLPVIVDNEELSKYAAKTKKKVTLKCKFCDRAFPYYKDLIDHLLKTHNNDELINQLTARYITNELNKFEEQKIIGKYYCLYCPRKNWNSRDSFACNRKTEMRAHMQVHTTKFHYCANAAENFDIIRLPSRADLREKCVKFNGNRKDLENN